MQSLLSPSSPRSCMFSEILDKRVGYISSQMTNFSRLENDNFSLSGGSESSSCMHSRSKDRDGATGTTKNSTKSSGKQSKKEKRGKSNYKHIPHKEKAPHLVAKRNARERRRVQAVNNAFIRLRRHVPYENKHKRLSKVKTLRVAIDYINRLKEMIKDYDVMNLQRLPVDEPWSCSTENRSVRMMELQTSKENSVRWISFENVNMMNRRTSPAPILDSSLHY